MVSIFDFIRNATGLCYFFFLIETTKTVATTMNNLIRWLWSHYVFFLHGRRRRLIRIPNGWMVAIKKSLGNFCLHHFTHMVTAIGAMYTAQPRLLALGDHMHNCNILMHIRMPLTALALCLHHLPFILCSIHRIDRIDNIIRHSYIEWVFAYGLS